MEDELIGNFMHKTICDEVIPTLDLPRQDLLDFAEAVDGRFKNPYIKHAQTAQRLCQEKMYAVFAWL